MGTSHQGLRKRFLWVRDGVEPLLTFSHVMQWLCFCFWCVYETWRAPRGETRVLPGPADIIQRLQSTSQLQPLAGMRHVLQRTSLGQVELVTAGLGPTGACISGQLRATQAEAGEAGPWGSPVRARREHCFSGAPDPSPASV